MISSHRRDGKAAAQGAASGGAFTCSSRAIPAQAGENLRERAILAPLADQAGEPEARASMTDRADDVEPTCAAGPRIAERRDAFVKHVAAPGLQGQPHLATA